MIRGVTLDALARGRAATAESEQSSGDQAPDAISGLASDAYASALPPSLEPPAGLAGTELAAAIRTSQRRRPGSPSNVSAADTDPSSAANQARLAKLAEVAGPDGAELIAELVKDPERLFDVDSQGQTLLDQLFRVATQELHSSIVTQDGSPMSNTQVLNGLLEDTARPGTLNQSQFPTCAVTAIQYRFVQLHPAEYARMVAELSGQETDGKATLPSGDPIELQQEYFTHDIEVDSRNPAEMIFQSAVLEYGNGEDEYEAWNTDSSAQGLAVYEQAVLMSKLFGGQFWGEQTNTPGKIERHLQMLERYEPEGKPPIIVMIRAGGRFHAWTFEGIRDGRMYVRNPYGPTTNDPWNGFRHETPEIGLGSIAIEDVRDRLNAIAFPAEARENLDDPNFGLDDYSVLGPALGGPPPRTITG